jgi:hypothetical protein
MSRSFYGELPQRNRLRIPQGRRGRGGPDSGSSATVTADKSAIIPADKFGIIPADKYASLQQAENAEDADKRLFLL